MYIVVPAASDIYTLKDLHNKRIQVSTRGSGMEFACRTLLELSGATYDDIRAKGGRILFEAYGSAASNMKDGHIDAFMMIGPLRHSIVMDLETHIPVRIVPIEGDILKRFLDEAFGFDSATMPAGTYRGQDKDVPILKYYCTMMANANLPDDLVYNITKVSFENLDVLHAVHEPTFSFITPKNALKGINPATLHPGAQKYLKEIGAL